MAQYIPKSALVAEIERRIEGINPLSQRVGVVGCSNTIKHLRGILSFIDTLEVKEVDLKEEVERFAKECGYKSAATIDFQFAKHFFELGMQVNNPITAADRGTAEEIIINLKRVEQDYRIDLTKEIGWVRNKAQKGE